MTDVSRRRILNILRIAVVLALLVIIACNFKRLRNLSEADIAALAQGASSLAIAIAAVLGLYCVKALLFVIPAMLLYVSVGAVFPLWLALAVNFAGIALELALTYGLGVFLGGAYVQNMLAGSRGGRKLLETQDRRGFAMLFTVRLLPVFPIDFAGLCFGSTRVPFWKHLLASLLGLFPRVALFTVFGEAARRFFPPWLLLAAAGAGLAGAVVMLAVKRLRGPKKENTQLSGGPMESGYATARDGEERELLRFLEKAFGNFPARFLRSLPKLYRPEYHPCRSNLLVREGKQIRAAVGLYPIEFYAGGEKLVAAGIGNVAVGKPWRGAGYMKLLMRQALELSHARGTDLLVLGGQRQRYQYFGFEKVGGVYSCHVSKTNLRHARLPQSNLTVEPLRPEDAESLRAIHALNEAAPLHCTRAGAPAALYDILCSWRGVPHVLRAGGAFAGYFISDQELKNVNELRLSDPANIPGAARAILGAAKKDVSFHLSPAETELAAFLTGICEGVGVGCPESFHVMNYERVLGAFLRLSARIKPLSEGEIVVRVNGWFEPETLRVRVRDGEISVTPTEDSPAVTLEHLAAMRCFFAPISPERNALPATAAAWFPLPLAFPGADAV